MRSLEEKLKQAVEDDGAFLFPVYNVMCGPEATESDKCRRMVVVDFNRNVFENHGLDRSYLLREYSPYICDKWSD